MTRADGRRAEATLLATDADAELAVLEVDTAQITPLTPADAGHPGIGAPVVALANPGGRGLRVALGFVTSAPQSLRSARHRRVQGALEHTAPLPRGSSGAPLVSVAGELLGLNAVRLDGGLILAVPASGAIVERLAEGRSAPGPRLGVAVAPPRAARRLRSSVGLPERDGVLVRAVADNTPASRAGLRRGDLIISLDGRAITTLDDLHELIEGAEGVIDLTVVRGVEEVGVPVTLVPSP